MSKKKKKSGTPKAKLEREGKAAAKAFLNRNSVATKKKMVEDCAVVEEILTSDPSLYDILFESLNNRINSGRVSIKELREVFTELMGDSAGFLLFFVLDMSPYQSAPLLSHFGVSESTISWVRRCFLAFGVALSHLEELETNPEDWRRLYVERLKKDGDDKVFVKVKITRIDGVKQTLFGSQRSLFQLAVKLLEEVTDGGSQTKGCQEKFLLRAEQILDKIHSKKKRKASLKKRKKG